ncbi:BnaC01g14320D [Brassica napus]|uniref:BnaC01g14320D protein n=2 Tax=Brassica napus TaxID=3708 RepID=A0A078FCW2_BRANA|nr:BnaC01g14320D [Brassica napus]
MDTQSDAPEASLANLGSASEQSESFDLTPAKRVRAVDIELEEINDQNSVTRSTGSMMIKKEKFGKSG